MTTAEKARKAFREAIQSQTFDPVYYLYGDEDYLKREGVRRLMEAAVDQTVRAFNLDQLRGSELQGEALGVVLGTPPMMAPRRVVVIRDVGALRAAARAALERYLKAPSTDTVLVLIAAAEDKPDKALIAATTAVEYERLNGTQLPKWISQRVEQTGGTIEPAAAALLCAAVGEDLTLLEVEVEKVLSYAGGAPVTEAAVEAVVGLRREETLGHLLDAVIEGNTEEALNALPLVLQQPKTTGVNIVMALTVQFMAMAWGVARNFPPARLSKEYFALLKSAGSVYTGRAWGEAVSVWVKYGARWSARDLDHALHALAWADQALKSSTLSSDEQLLSTLLLTICQPRARRRAA